MALRSLRSWFFDHKGKEYEVRAELISENVHEPAVMVRALDPSGNEVELSRGVTAIYSVPISVQNANLRRLLSLDAGYERAARHDQRIQRRKHQADATATGLSRR